MGILNISGKSKTRKPNLQKDLREMLLVTRTGIELNFCNFITYRNFGKMPILRGLKAFEFSYFIKVFSNFSYL